MNSTVVPAPRLEFLGDVFAVPRWVPFANVFSIGDICIAVGAVLVVHGICRKNAAGDLEKVTVVTSGS